MFSRYLYPTCRSSIFALRRPVGRLAAVALNAFILSLVRLRASRSFASAACVSPLLGFRVLLPPRPHAEGEHDSLRQKQHPENSLICSQLRRSSSCLRSAAGCTPSCRVSITRLREASVCCCCPSMAASDNSTEILSAALAAGWDEKASEAHSRLLEEEAFALRRDGALLERRRAEDAGLAMGSHKSRGQHLKVLLLSLPLPLLLLLLAASPLAVRLRPSRANVLESPESLRLSTVPSSAAVPLPSEPPSSPRPGCMQSRGEASSAQRGPRSRQRRPEPFADPLHSRPVLLHPETQAPTEANDEPPDSSLGASSSAPQRGGSIITRVHPPTAVPQATAISVASLLGEQSNLMFDFSLLPLPEVSENGLEDTGAEAAEMALQFIPVVASKVEAGLGPEAKADLGRFMALDGYIKHSSNLLAVELYKMLFPVILKAEMYGLEEKKNQQALDEALAAVSSSPSTASLPNSKGTQPVVALPASASHKHAEYLRRGQRALRLLVQIQDALDTGAGTLWAVGDLVASNSLAEATHPSIFGKAQKKLEELLMGDSGKAELPAAAVRGLHDLIRAKMLFAQRALEHARQLLGGSATAAELEAHFELLEYAEHRVGVSRWLAVTALAKAQMPIFFASII